MSTYSDKQEIEWQFDALDLRPVTRWLEAEPSSRELDGFEVEPLGEKKLFDSYLDTEDWRVFRAGYALRVRRKGGASDESYEATMKLLDSVGAGDDGLKTRREISETLTSDALSTLVSSEGPVGGRLRALAGKGDVAELFRVETSRRTYRIVPKNLRRSEDHGGDIVPSVEVALDETKIPVEGGEPISLKRVEVEVEVGEVRDFADFVEGLVARFRLTPASTSKFEAGILGLELSPPNPPDFGSVVVTEDLTTGEVAFAVLRRQFGSFLAHEPGARIGEDLEELHDMRVASRRMRAAIKIFKNALPARSAHFERELKWIAACLGEVRDLDVQLEQLDVWLVEADQEDRASLEEIRSALQEGRKKARLGMLRSLETRRYERFIELYTAFLVRGPSRRTVGSRLPVVDSGSRLISKPYRKFRRLGDRISPDSLAEEYHELRKRGKRLRYTLEFLTPVYGGAAKDLVSTLKVVQDVLGDHQDADTAAGRLRTLAPPASPARRSGGLMPRTYFVMGEIAARYAAEAKRLRELLPGVYSKMKGKSWKRLKKDMRRRAFEVQKDEA
ncbi:MAG: CHAD domain-containing protein [Rubrobacter sp.]